VEIIPLGMTKHSDSTIPGKLELADLLALSNILVFRLPIKFHNDSIMV